MTPEPPRPSLEADLDDDERIKKLLRDAMAAPAPEQPDVLRLVQRRLREQSQGKFYGEGWSTSKDPPVATYLVTTLVMLLITLAIYLLLGTLYGVQRLP